VLRFHCPSFLPEYNRQEIHNILEYKFHALDLGFHQCLFWPCWFFEMCPSTQDFTHRDPDLDGHWHCVYADCPYFFDSCKSLPFFTNLNIWNTETNSVFYQLNLLVTLSFLSSYYFWVYRRYPHLFSNTSITFHYSLWNYRRYLIAGVTYILNPLSAIIWPYTGSYGAIAGTRYWRSLHFWIYVSATFVPLFSELLLFLKKLSMIVVTYSVSYGTIAGT